jgi:hypothetical protein
MSLIQFITLVSGAGHQPELFRPSRGALGLAVAPQEQGRVLRQAGEGAIAERELSQVIVDSRPGARPKRDHVLIACTFCPPISDPFFSKKLKWPNLT